MRKHRWTWHALIAAGLGILAILVYRVNPGKAIEAIAEVNPIYVAGAVGAYSLVILLRAWKWHHLARRLNLHIRFTDFAGTYFVFYFFSSLTPLRSADLFAPLAIGGNQHSGKLMRSMLIDRFSELCILGILSLFSAGYLLERQVISLHWGMLSLFLAAIAACGFGAVRLGKIRRLLEELVQVVKALGASVILIQCCLGAIVWLLDFSYIYAMLVGMGLRQLPFVQSAVFQVGSTIFSILTFVPAGIGSGALSYSYLAGLFHYPYDTLIVGLVSAKLVFILTIAAFLLTGTLMKVITHKKEISP